MPVAQDQNWSVGPLWILPNIRIVVHVFREILALTKVRNIVSIKNVIT